MIAPSSSFVVASAPIALAVVLVACGDSSEGSDWSPSEPDSGSAGAADSGTGGQAGASTGGTGGGAGAAGKAGASGGAGASTGGTSGAGGSTPPKDPTCAANASNGDYCGGDKVDDADPDTLYTCSGPGPASVKQKCAQGCVVAPAGQDDYCKKSGPTCASDAETGFYCGGDKVDNADPGTLYTCDGPGAAVVKEKCSLGCVVAAAGYDDYCKKPAATCAANASTGDYCGGDKVDNADADTLYSCTGPGPATVKQKCAEGCAVAPAGQDDYCKSSAVYYAPWTCGESHTCSNGNHTSSHDGKDEYAYDFAMSVGTTLRAMRGGKVLRTRLVSSPGDPCYDGGGSSCANAANTVEVIHADGTVALYMHLSSIAVSTGQSVDKGTVVGKSGNSGWTTGPHLHLQLQENCGIWWCQSIPFHLVEAPSLSAGVTVKSQNCN